MKGFTPNLEAMRQRLEKNKEKNSKKEKISIHERPDLKVAGPGKYKFRATYYPHSEDPAAEPFPIRHYHFGIPGGTFYCPQMNEGGDCAICDFVWSMMKEHGKNGPNPDKDKVSEWADKLPKARLWIPGLLRNHKDDEGNLVERENEGCKMFSFGTALDKMSKNHEKIISWFFSEDEDEQTSQWLSPDKGDEGGFDMVLEYESYTGDDRGKRFKANFGLKDISLSRTSTPFGKGKAYEEFLASIPNIDDNDLPILSSYTRKTSEQSLEVLENWQKRLNKNSGKVSTAMAEEADTSSDDDADSVDSGETEAAESGNKSAILDRLATLGIKR